MATSIALHAADDTETRRPKGSRFLLAVLLTAGLAAGDFVINGYHPYAEDGGVYIPGVKYLLDTSLYPASRGFVTGPLRYSVFARVLAGIVSGTGLGLETVWLLVYVASIWGTLAAGWALASRSFERMEARLGAVSLLAVWLTMPVAGTSLMLTDPYVTARSFSTPLTLLALVATIDLGRSIHRADKRPRRSIALLVSALAGAGMMHPLMAAYGAGCLVVLGCLQARDRRVQVWGTLGLCGAAFLIAGVLWARPVVESAAYLRAAESRPYWFLGRWQWFELIGLGAPMLILVALALYGRRCTRTLRSLAGMSVVSGLTAVGVAVVFARENSASHAVAMLQPLRIFQTVYFVMILTLGGLLGEALLRRHWWRWALCFAALSTATVRIQRKTFPASPPLEIGGSATGSAPEQGFVGEFSGRVDELDPPNQWEAAFTWIRGHTPKDALFALPPDYVTEPGEDAQGFRAIAERSALADFSKDGGEAAITPELAPEWVREQDALAELDSATDGARVQRLRPFGVTWVVLPGRARTEFACPYRSTRVQVCRIR